MHVPRAYAQADGQPKNNASLRPHHRRMHVDRKLRHNVSKPIHAHAKINVKVCALQEISGIERTDRQLRSITLPSRLTWFARMTVYHYRYTH